MNLPLPIAERVAAVRESGHRSDVTRGARGRAARHRDGDRRIDQSRNRKVSPIQQHVDEHTRPPTFGPTSKKTGSASPLSRELIQPGERFALTDDQASAVTPISDGLETASSSFCSKRRPVRARPKSCSASRSPKRCAPAVTCASSRRRATSCARIAPTCATGWPARASASASCTAAPAAERRCDDLAGLRGQRALRGRRMLLISTAAGTILDHSALTIIDDVNAFDEREHLRLLEGLDCPLLFASATPNELRASSSASARIRTWSKCAACRSTCSRRRSTSRRRLGRTARGTALARRRADPRTPRAQIAHLRHRAHARRRAETRRAARSDVRVARAAAARRHGRYERAAPSLSPQGAERSRGRRASKTCRRSSRPRPRF